MKKIYKILLMLSILLCCFLLFGCTPKDNNVSEENKDEITSNGEDAQEDNSMSVKVVETEADESVKPVSFESSKKLLENPDRGLRMETYITLGEPLYAYPLSNENPFEKAQNMIQKYEADSPKLCQLYVYLSNYRKTLLDETAFNQLERILKIFEDNGIRVLLRFAYSTESVKDTSYKYVKMHLAQLDEWFKNNDTLVDKTLYCLQTGIIGYWGEGHSNVKLKNRYKADVINEVCKLAPEGIYTQVRTSDMLDLVTDENKSRVGIHDDYIIGDLSHEWSFIPSDNEAFDKVIDNMRFTINDGEMPWGKATLNDKEGEVSLGSLDGKNVLKQLYTYCLTSFSLEHNYIEDDNEYSLAKWKKEKLSYNEVKERGITVNPYLFKDENSNDIKLSIYDVIRFHLGYQLMLSNYSFEDGKLKFAVTNYGFAAPLNFNYFAVVIKDMKTGKISEKEIKCYDKTLLSSGKSAEFTIEIEDGFEAVGVKMDTFSGRGVNPHFANDTPFIDGIQYFAS